MAVTCGLSESVALHDIPKQPLASGGPPEYALQRKAIAEIEVLLAQFRIEPASARMLEALAELNGDEVLSEARRRLADADAERGFPAETGRTACIPRPGAAPDPDRGERAPPAPRPQEPASAVLITGPGAPIRQSASRVQNSMAYFLMR